MSAATPTATVYMPDGTQHAVTGPKPGVFSPNELQAMVRGPIGIIPNTSDFRLQILATKMSLDGYACICNETGQDANGQDMQPNGQIGYGTEPMLDFKIVGPVAVMLAQFID